MGIAERKARHKKELQETILQAAVELIERDGVEKLTLRKLAARIEYSPATIYLYYKDKDELLYALHEEGFRRMYAFQLPCMQIADSRERIKEIGRTYIEFGRKHPAYFELMFTDPAPIRTLADLESQNDGEPAWECGKDVFELMHSTVVELLEKRLIHPAPSHVVAFYLWSMVHGMTSLVNAQRMSAFPEEVVQEMINHALDYTLANMHLQPS